MLQRILVPTNSSELSQVVLPIVRGLAQVQGAEVILAQVVDPTAGFMPAPDEPEMDIALLDALETDANEGLARFVNQFGTESFPVKTAVLHGPVSPALLNYQMEVRPDLVIMATRAHTGLARLVFGSVADRMVLEGSTPVLLAGPSANVPTTIARALVPLDGSALAEEALLAVELLAGRPIRLIRLLRATATDAERGPAGAYLQEVASGLSGGGFEVETQVTLGAPADAIEAAARDVDAVIMATHGRGGLDRLRHGSVTQEVVGRVERPIIVVRPRFRKLGADVGEFLCAVRVFGQLQIPLVERIATLAQERAFGEGDAIVREGDPGVELFVIRDGQVEVVEGDKRLRLMGSGEVFGEIALLERRPRTATVRALQPTTCFMINALALRRVLEESPETLQQFQAMIRERLGVRST